MKYATGKPVVPAALLPTMRRVPGDVVDIGVAEIYTRPLSLTPPTASAGVVLPVLETNNPNGSEPSSIPRCAMLVVVPRPIAPAAPNELIVMIALLEVALYVEVAR